MFNSPPITSSLFLLLNGLAGVQWSYALHSSRRDPIGTRVTQAPSTPLPDIFISLQRSVLSMWSVLAQPTSVVPQLLHSLPFPASTIHHHLPCLFAVGRDWVPRDGNSSRHCSPGFRTPTSLDRPDAKRTGGCDTSGQRAAVAKTPARQLTRSAGAPRCWCPPARMAHVPIAQPSTAHNRARQGNGADEHARPMQVSDW